MSNLVEMFEAPGIRSRSQSSDLGFLVSEAGTQSTSCIEGQGEGPSGTKTLGHIRGVWKRVLERCRQSFADSRETIVVVQQTRRARLRDKDTSRPQLAFG